jgi:hypothetical protein
MDTTKLWYYALNGSPLVQAIALTLLDKILDGAISRLGREIPNAKSGKRF